mmetsp:Transcript_82063/g.213761  ORF Transcript_82063/g.213761 Transcript_82063/m.213761 type:complete len:220 (+) Transcript_82063:736-1395(+)
MPEPPCPELRQHHRKLCCILGLYCQFVLQLFLDSVDAVSPLSTSNADARVFHDVELVHLCTIYPKFTRDLLQGEFCIFALCILGRELALRPSLYFVSLAHEALANANESGQHQRISTDPIPLEAGSETHLEVLDVGNIKELVGQIAAIPALVITMQTISAIEDSVLVWTRVIISLAGLALLNLCEELHGRWYEEPVVGDSSRYHRQRCLVLTMTALICL